MGKPGSSSYREFGRGLKPLIYKNLALPSLRFSSSFSRLRTHIYLITYLSHLSLNRILDLARIAIADGF
jgi:hypothetical protein